MVPAYGPFAFSLCQRIVKRQLTKGPEGMDETRIQMLMLEASKREVGVKIATNNPQLLRNKMYALRRKSGNFQNLSFLIPMEEGVLLVFKKEEPDGAPED